MNERTQYSPAAADSDHSYFQKSQLQSVPLRELPTPLQSLDLEMEQGVEGKMWRMPCWTSGMPRAAGGGLSGGSVCVLGVSVSDPAHGCRGSRTVMTPCVASAWTRYGTSPRLSGSSASCPTAVTPAAWAACGPGRRTEGTPCGGHQVSVPARREGGKGPREVWAWRQANGLVTPLLPPPTPPLPRRTCPQCHVHSSYLIPCKFWVSEGPEKEQLIRNFKAQTR